MTINSWNSQDPAEVAKGGYGVVSNTAYSVLCGGTTSTSPIQSIASVGTATQVLLSGGSGSLPSFQSMTPIFLATKVITSAQFKNLLAVPQIVIAAQGAGTVICPIKAYTKMTYGGTNAFVAGDGSINLTYGTTNLFGMGNMPSNYTGTVSSYDTHNFFVTMNATAIASIENVAMYCFNTGSTDVTGNAANNNTVTLSVLYTIFQI